MLTSLRAVLRNRALTRVQLALVFSLVGDAAYATAVTVWAYGEGGAAAVGLFTAVRLLAAAILAPVGATLADRHSRRQVLVFCDAGRAVLVAAAAVCLVLDVTIGVYALATLAGVLNAPFRTTQRAWLPALAEDPGELAAANASASTLESLAVLAGPALGALLVALVGVTPVFLFNVATFLVSLVLVLMVPATTRPERHEESGILAELAAGFRLLAVDADLRSVTGQICAQTFVGGAVKVLLVVLAVDVLGTGPSGVGVLEAVLGVGAVAGGAVALARVSADRLGRDLACGVILWSAPLALIVAWPSVPTVLLALVVLGVANPVVDVNLDTIVQRMTPDHLLARAFGALDTCYIATSALGAALAPLLLEAVGLRWTLAAIGAPVLLVAMVSYPRMKRLDVRLLPPPHLELLRGLPVFAGVSPAVLEQLARASRVTEVPVGAVVVREGEIGDAFHVLADGRVQVTQEGHVIGTQAAGEFFGEIALLRDLPRTATVAALSDLVLVSLDRDAFLRALTGEGLSAAHEVAARRLGAGA